MDGREEIELKQRLVVGCRILEDNGIFDDQGHLSARAGDDPETVLMNEHTSPGIASMQEFVPVDLSTDGYPEGVPSEAPIHGEIYRAREDVGAVCHHHSPYATVVSSVGLDMRPVHQGGIVQRGPIAVYEDYDREGGMLVTTDREARTLAEMLGDDRAIMLRGHGAVVAGRTVVEAVMACLRLEYNARLLYRQALLGEPWYLPEDLVEESMEFAYDPYKLEKTVDYYLRTDG